MKKHETRNLVFSSSCTVYGAPDQESLPITESSSTGACHCPYAKCKYMIEEMLSDLAQSSSFLCNIVVLRYFNPVGAHPSGLLGEDPKGVPLNLMPKIAQVSKKKKLFSVNNIICYFYFRIININLNSKAKLKLL